MRKQILLLLIFTPILFGSCNSSKSVVVYFSLVGSTSNNVYNNYDEVGNSGSLSDGNFGFHVGLGETKEIELFYTDENDIRSINCFHLPKGYAIKLTNRYGNTIATYNSIGDSYNFKIKDLK